MNLNNILDYQKKDAELIKLERALYGSENKKISNQMINVVKETQNQSAMLENQAQQLIKSYTSLKKTYEENSKTANLILNKNLDAITEEEIFSIENVAQKVANNLAILEKKLLASAESVRDVLSNFEQAKKKYNLAKEKYNKHKALFDEDEKKIKPEIEKKTQEVKQIERGIDKEILAKYKQKRQDKIYPVFVPCIDKTCGGCRMELPSASLSTLKNNGVLECEHCRRIIYFQ